jgi:A/G-specific adenine glycosylase
MTFLSDSVCGKPLKSFWLVIPAQFLYIALRKRILIRSFLRESAMVAVETKKATFARRLLKWGKRNRRDFSWRREMDAFHILVAEIMLQRTGAQQVEPVYRRFIAKYPLLHDLASAPLENVLDDLRSLGLAYRGARLKQVADIIETQFGGKIPDGENELLSLPGIGKYVANAVQCFAFKKDLPLVDSNVLRVLDRVFSIKSVPDSHKKLQMWHFMSNMIPEGRAKEFNLSLLDFAGVLCAPKTPHHEICPMRGICDFYKLKKSGHHA